MARRKKETNPLYTAFYIRLFVQEIYKDLSRELQPYLTEESGHVLNDMEEQHLIDIEGMQEATAIQIKNFLKTKDSEFIEETISEWQLDESKMIDELELAGHIVIQSPSIPEIYKLDEFLGHMSENPYQLNLLTA